MSLNFALLTITVCLISQTAQGDACAVSDNDVNKEIRKCKESLMGEPTLCCNFDDFPVNDNTCVEYIPEDQQIYMSMTVRIDPFDIQCLIKTGRNLGLLDVDLEKLIRQTLTEINQTLTEINQTLTTFKSVRVDRFDLVPEPNSAKPVFSLIFSEVINSRIKEVVALTVLALEEKGRVSALGFTATFTQQTGIFETRATVSSNVDFVEWCSSPRLHTCPPHSTCNDVGIRYKCTCNKGYVDIQNGTACSATVRLANGSSALDGRAEYYTNGVWLAVCKEKFKSREAKVFCRQLGYIWRGGQITSQQGLTLSMLNVYNYNFLCDGDEAYLSDCNTEPRSESCSKEQGVHIRCEAGCPDEYHYGINCSEPCDCVTNNTEFCDRHNATCNCSAGWEGATCSQDVDECDLGTHDCKSVHETCENTNGSFRCLCAPHATKKNGVCVGTLKVVGQRPFRTDGQRDLNLTCNIERFTEKVNFTWSVRCDSQSYDSCTFKPDPSVDDGKVVTCTATYRNGQSDNATFTLDLNYPPISAPEIHGYDEEVLNAGDDLVMTCIVSGGKPLVKSVNFRCQHHLDRPRDIEFGGYKQSLLFINPLHATDNGILCVCSADWEDTNWYDRNVRKTLTVQGTYRQTNAQSEGLNAGVVAGIAVGVVIIVILTIIIAIFAWKQKWRLTYARPKKIRESEISPYSVYKPSREVKDEYAEIKDYSDNDHHRTEPVGNNSSEQLQLSRTSPDEKEVTGSEGVQSKDLNAEEAPNPSDQE